jgi:hypothetical protein
MTRSESIAHLAAALANAQAEMPVAVFDATNPFLKNKYASLGSVIQASRPILAKHRLSLVQFPISAPAAADIAISAPQPSPVLRTPSPGPAGEGHRGGGSATCDYIGVESILAHESGEFVAERILIPLVEEKGKSKVQSAGSTLTYLRRYSWASILGMYSDEDSDGTVAPSARMVAAPPANGERRARSDAPYPAPPPPPTQRQITN